MIKLQVQDDELGPIRARLAEGRLALGTDVPFPPDTRVCFELLDGQGRIAHRGRGRVDAWRTLPAAVETGEPPGMWIRVEQLDGVAVELPAVDPDAPGLYDVSELVAAAIDLDAEDEPVPLPGPRPEGPPDLQFVDLSELRAAQFDLDGQEPAPPEVEEPAPVTRRSVTSLRQDARATVEIPVQARCLPDGRAFSAQVWNLSSGGLFLRTSEPLARGGMLLLEARLPGQEAPVCFRAEVVWVQAAFDPDQPPRVPGVGIRFVDLTPALGEEIRCHVETSLVGEEALEPVLPVAPPQPAPEPASTPVEQEAPRPALSAQTERRMVVDALMTALDLSGVESFRDNDTIRYLLGSWFVRYYDQGVVDLTLLWNTLAAEPTVSAVEAALPLFIFGLARAEHGLAVKLPEGLQRFDAADETLALARQRLARAGSFRAAYERVARRATEAASLAAQEGARTTRPESEPEPAGKKALRRAKNLAPWPRKRPAGGPARGLRDEPGRLGKRLLIGLCALVALAVSLWLVQPRRAVELDPAGLEDVLGLEQARAQGSHLQATIRDPRWAELDTEERRELLRELVVRLEQQGIESALFFDPHLRVTALYRAEQEPGTGPLLQIDHEILAQGAAGAAR
jgi:uncharacterized protein (TIGR02266 family)